MTACHVLSSLAVQALAIISLAFSKTSQPFAGRAIISSSIDIHDILMEDIILVMI